VSEDAIARLCSGDVNASPADEHAELELVIENVGVTRPTDIGVGADHAEAIALVVDRLRIPNIRRQHDTAADVVREGGRRIRLSGRHLAKPPLARVAQVLLEAQKIAHLARYWHWRQQHDLGTQYYGIIDTGADRPIEESARVVERALAAVDQGEHGQEILC